MSNTECQRGKSSFGASMTRWWRAAYLNIYRSVPRKLKTCMHFLALWHPQCSSMWQAVYPATYSHSIIPQIPEAMHAGWPVPPSRQPWCGICPAGWATTVIDAQHCMLCRPGTYAAARRSPECAPCANGTYAYSWGSTHCNHCIIGTYAPWRVQYTFREVLSFMVVGGTWRHDLTDCCAARLYLLTVCIVLEASS